MLIVLLGMILIGVLTGTTAAVTSMVIGQGFLYALTSYAVAGSTSVLLIAVAVQLASLSRREATADGRSATA